MEITELQKEAIINSGKEFFSHKNYSESHKEFAKA